MTTSRGVHRRLPGRTTIAGAVLSTAVAVSVLTFPAGPASAADSGAAPVLAAVTRSPVSAVPAYNGILANTTWTPSTSTGLRDWFTDPKVTLSFSATDETDVAKFVVQVGSTGVPVDVPARAAGSAWTGSFDVVGDQSSTVTYTAVDSAGHVSAPRTTLVKIDRTAPSATWPGVVGGEVAHSATYAAIKPALVDTGSGGPAIREMFVDGTSVDLVPLDVATLPVGGHTWAIVVGDAAGNQSRHTLSFRVTTSYADLAALVDRYTADGRISGSNATVLRELLTLAGTLTTAGDPAGAMAALADFSARAAQYAPRGVARTVLVGDADHLRASLGGAATAPFTTGVTVEAAGPAQRQPQVYAGGSVVNAKPDFKVLLFANRVGGFRHQHIPATMKFIQEQGKRENFDVDIWDYMAPAESVPGNPFESVQRLGQYDAIVAVSSVGNSQFITNRPTVADPTVLVDEQAVLKQYVNDGGGFVAIHGATDSMHSWDWYKDLVGGEFDNHSSSVNGQQHNCEACRTTEVVTEDRTNPTTDHFPRSTRVLDELYNWKTFLPRERVHVLQTLTEASYVGGLNAGDGRNEGADHPISWCRNFDGGRSYTQALMHNYELSDDPLFQEQILGAIRWTAGETEANCVTHTEVQSLLGAQRAAGTLSTQAADQVLAQVAGSFTAYLATDYSLAAARAREAARLLENASAGTPAALGTARAATAELVEWMQMLDTTSPRLRFTAEPQDATASVGRDTAFTVAANGVGVEYQWQRQAPGAAGWSDVVGETTVALRVVARSVGESGTQYRVRIADVGSELYSRPAVLSVTPAPPVTPPVIPPVTPPVAQQPTAQKARTVLVVKAGKLVVRKGRAVTVSATVLAAPGVLPGGAVTLLDGRKVVGSAVLQQGVATFRFTSKAVRKHRLTVRYTGSTTTEASVSSVVKVTVRR